MVIRRSRPLLLAVLVASTIGALVIGVSAAAAANGGTLANAKLCQKGGWRDLVTATGAGFASEVDCVLYAARGGTPQTRYRYLQSQYQAICEQHNGLFFLNGEAGWGCRSSLGSLTQAGYDALGTPCRQAGGTPSGNASHGEYVAIYCDGIAVGPASPAPGSGGELLGPIGVQVTVALGEAQVLVLGIGPVEPEDAVGFPHALRGHAPAWR